jgi:hypothetical protein
MNASQPCKTYKDFISLVVSTGGGWDFISFYLLAGKESYNYNIWVGVYLKEGTSNCPAG